MQRFTEMSSSRACGRFLSNLLLLAGLLLSGLSHAQSRLEVLFAYGSEKEEWIKAVTADYNKSRPKTTSGKIVTVRAIPMGSGECMDRVANGSLKANLVSPASGIFIKLANAEVRTRTGKDLVGETENLVLSPVVIAVWKPMAEALGWGTKPVGWGEILSLSKNPDGWGSLQAPQWGQFLVHPVDFLFKLLGLDGRDARLLRMLVLG
jgi:Ca-activated chloride channel family protein